MKIASGFRDETLTLHAWIQEEGDMLALRFSNGYRDYSLAMSHDLNVLLDVAESEFEKEIKRHIEARLAAQARVNAGAN
jgi:hypothetical protein